MKSILFSVMLLCLSLNGLCANSDIGKLVYNKYVLTSNSTCCLYYGTFNSNGLLDIPDTINYNKRCYKVTEIRDEFMETPSYNASLTLATDRVALGDYIEKIGKKAFRFASVGKLYLNTAIKEIGEEAFCGNAKHGGFSIYTDIKTWCNIDFGKNVFKQTSVELYLNRSSSISSSSISIPSGVTEIKTGAFCNNKGIQNVTMTNSVTRIGDDAFYGCIGITNKKFKMSPNVTEIGDSAFYNCAGLTSLPITDKVKEIKDGTFMLCTGLTSVIIPNNITSIGNSAFAGCTEITSLTIPGSVTSIGEEVLGNAYYNTKNKIKELHCRSMNPSSIRISSISFVGVNSYLCKLYVPKGTKALYENADVWKKWANYIVEEEIPYVKVSPSSLSLEKGAEKQIYASVKNSKTNYELSYSSSDTTIAEISQKGVIIAKRKGSVVITVKAANDVELGYCNVSVTKKRQSITWNQSFEEIKVGDEIALTATASSGLAVEYAITKGSEYAEITDGKLVCKAAGDITIEARQDGNDEYEAAESVSKTISISDVTRNIPITIDGITYDYCEDNKKELQVISNTADVATIKSEVEGLPVTTINRPAFYHDLNVTEVQIPASVTDIKDLSFEQNYNLATISVDANNPNYCDVDGVLYSKDKKTLVTFPAGKATSYTVIDGTTAVGDHAFSCNAHLEYVSIPEGVTSIGFDAFFQCYGLKNFTMPSTVTSLDFGVLRDCSNLKEIHSLISNPSGVFMGSRVFEGVDKDKCLLYVPVGTKLLYEVADQWKDFENIVEEDATGIKGTFANGISFVVKNRTFMIKNAPANSNIRIYTVTGQLVYAGQETTIQLSDAGTYIMEIDRRIRKICVK